MGQKQIHKQILTGQHLYSKTVQVYLLLTGKTRQMAEA